MLSSFGRCSQSLQEIDFARMILSSYVIFIAFVLLCVVFSKHWQAADEPNLPPSEISALQSFYQATQGYKWAWTANAIRWNFTSNPNPCAEGWYGVNCTRSPAADGYLHVIDLKLPKYNLCGSLPSALEDLTELRGIDLSNNNINGTLSHSIDTFAKLQTLDLSLNYLSGTLPSALGNMSNLSILRLNFNELFGTLPPKLGSLTNLRQLQVSNNGLIGTLPPELGNLGELQWLYLGLNYFTGTLPPELGKLTKLQILYLRGNMLHGSLPPSLGELTSLTTLDVQKNLLLSGPIPTSVGNLSQLQYLLLNNNQFTGSISSQLGNLRKLVQIHLYYNFLTGTLPPQLGDLPLLIELCANNNQLSGTLPAAYGKLTTVTTLNFYNTLLTGTLPAQLQNMSALKSSMLYNNSFTGTLPAGLGKLKHLTHFDLFQNRLEGPLPPEWGNLTSMQFLYIYQNFLTGKLIPEWGNMINLLELSAYENLFTGELPQWGRNNTHLRLLYINQNLLTGSIPSEWGLFTHMQIIYLYENMLTGALPKELGQLPELRVINASWNWLSGTLPSELLSAQSIQCLDFNNNQLQGTLPQSLSTAHKLKYFSVASNALTGCLPPLGELRWLQAVDVSHNKLRCSLEGVFDGVNSSSVLLNVQLGHNRFTGNLPASVFLAPKLITFVAASSCLSGVLPMEICQATSLQSLILDGLGTAPVCVDSWAEWLLTGEVRIPQRFHGTIPECVVSMPNLTSLHLSGNNLAGTLASSVVLSTTLTEMYVSHNLLEGTLPAFVQTHPWSILDTSYNRFTGSLLSDFGEASLPLATQQKMAVGSSRISGDIPPAMLDLRAVSILGSNIFACKADKSDVPNTDGTGDKNKYECGSDSFDNPFYAFLGIACVLAVATACVLYLGGKEVAARLGVLRTLHQWNMPRESFPAGCQHLYGMLTALCQVAIYGVVVAIVVLVPWYSAASHYYGTYTHQYAWAVSAAFLSGLAPGLVEFFLWSVLAMLIAVVAVYLTPKVEASLALPPPHTEAMGGADPHRTVSLIVRTKAYAQFLLVNILARLAVNVLFVYVTLNGSSETVQAAQVALSLWKFGWNAFCMPYLVRRVSKLLPTSTSNGFFRVQAFVSLVNTIAIPCLVVAAQSPSCFRDVLFEPSADESDKTLGVDCLTTQTVQSSFTPQFTYSYQCSSSFITYYSASMIYYAITSIAVVPAVRCLLCGVVRHTTPGTKLHEYCIRALPRLWRVPEVVTDQAEHLNPKSYVDAQGLMVSMTVFLGILLSFGVVFPPVALAMCVAMLFTAWQTKLLVGRLLCNAREVGAEMQVAAVVEQDCRAGASQEKLRSVIILSVMFGCYFYALFIFDTIGDAEGFWGAVWVLLLMPAVPGGIYVYARYAQVGRESPQVVHNDEGRMMMGSIASGKAIDMTVRAGQARISKEGKGEGTGSGISEDAVSTTENVLHAEASEANV